MAQIIHCCMLLYIVFIIAEIKNVLTNSDPRQAEPVTLWEEAQPPPGDPGFKLSWDK